MQVVLDAFKGLNPFDRLFDGSPDEDTLRQIHALSDRSPLTEHDIPRALEVLRELDQISNLNISNIDDFNALNNLIGSNEALIQALSKYRNLALYLERFTFKGVLVHSPNDSPSRHQSEREIERLANENRILQERLLRMHNDMEQLELNRAVELSRSQTMNMERIGNSIQTDYALNKEFHLWIDAFLRNEERLRELTKSSAAQARSPAGLDDLHRASELCRVTTAAMNALSLAQENGKRFSSHTEEMDNLRNRYEELRHQTRRIEDEKFLLENNRNELLGKMFSIRQSLQEGIFKLMSDVHELTLEEEKEQMIPLTPAPNLAEEFNLLEALIRKNLITVMGVCSKKISDLNENLSKQVESKREQDHRHWEAIQQREDKERALAKKMEEQRNELQQEIVRCQMQIKMLETKNRELEGALGNEKLQVKRLQKKLQELESKLSAGEFGILGPEKEAGELREKNRFLQAQVKELAKLQQELEAAKDEIQFLNTKVDKMAHAEEASRKKAAQLGKELENSQIKLEIEADNVQMLEDVRKRLQKQNTELMREHTLHTSQVVALKGPDPQEDELRILRLFINADPDRKRQFESFVKHSAGLA